MSNPVSRQRSKGYVKPRQPSALKGLCQTPSAVSAQRVMSNPVSRQRLKGYVKPRQQSALKGLCQTPSAVSAQRVMYPF